jgi:hypothetical protein
MTPHPQFDFKNEIPRGPALQIVQEIRVGGNCLSTLCVGVIMIVA